jgi:hypothetical protein
MTAAHASTELIARYAAGESLPSDAEWALEAHLDGCAACRARLAGAVAGGIPTVSSIVDSVWAAVEPRIQQVQPTRRRAWPRLVRWAAPGAAPWLVATVLVPLVAMLLDLVYRRGGATGLSIVELVVPVVPLLGVAASWSRRVDPAFELVASTARYGPGLAARRILTVLVAVVPPLAVATAVAGAAPDRWVLPCLAFTTGALALGTVIGVVRAAAAAIVGWTAAVVAPSIAHARPPAVLQPRHAPVWAACALLAAVALVLWRDALRRPASHR